MLHSNTSIPEAIKIATNLGCVVKNKRRHGEIYFKHKNITKPYLISNNKDSIGKGFLSWIRPLIKEKNKMLDEKSIMYKIAKSVRELVNDQFSEISLDDINNKISEHTRKQITDQMTQLVKRGYFSRIDLGKFTPKIKLFEEFQLPDTKLVVEEVIQEENINKIIQNVKVEQNSQTLLDDNRITKLEDKMNIMLNRFDTYLNKLEMLINKFQNESDIKDAVAIMEEALKKRAKK